MKHVHKLARIGLFVNIIICFVARNLLLDEGQLNFHRGVDSMWSGWFLPCLSPWWFRRSALCCLAAILIWPSSGVCWRHRDGARQRDLSGG